MTIAELHGKLSPDKPMGVSERLEDLLTSDVFGTMKYVGWKRGFIEWLLNAEVAPVEPQPPPIEYYLSKSKITNVEFKFWPRLANGREPDLALLISFDLKDYLLILIEAKYFSRTSDWEMDEETDPFGLTGNQIADQINGLNNMSPKDLFKWFESTSDSKLADADVCLEKIHLFITMHNVLPVNDYENSTKQIGNTWPIHAYWLSWVSLSECLKKHFGQTDYGLNSLIKDLYDLLHRKGLVPFRGFEMRPWYSGQKSRFFWNEHYWDLQPLHLDKYRSFWQSIFWKQQPIGHLTSGFFWEEG